MTSSKRITRTGSKASPGVVAGTYFKRSKKGSSQSHDVLPSSNRPRRNTSTTKCYKEPSDEDNESSDEDNESSKEEYRVSSDMHSDGSVSKSQSSSDEELAASNVLSPVIEEDNDQSAGGYVLPDGVDVSLMQPEEYMPYLRKLSYLNDKSGGKEELINKLKEMISKKTWQLRAKLHGGIESRSKFEDFVADLSFDMELFILEKFLEKLNWRSALWRSALKKK